MTIDNKWKRFSIEVHFSACGCDNHGVDLPAEWVYDRLMDCASEDEWNGTLEELNMVIWYPFENMPWDDLRDSLLSTARNAQQYSEAAA